MVTHWLPWRQMNLLLQTLKANLKSHLLWLPESSKSSLYCQVSDFLHSTLFSGFQSLNQFSDKFSWYGSVVSFKELVNRGGSFLGCIYYVTGSVLTARDTGIRDLLPKGHVFNSFLAPHSSTTANGSCSYHSTEMTHQWPVAKSIGILFSPLLVCSMIVGPSPQNTLFLASVVLNSPAFLLPVWLLHPVSAYFLCPLNIAGKWHGWFMF